MLARSSSANQPPPTKQSALESKAVYGETIREIGFKAVQPDIHWYSFPV
jgi:hypothetical protein